MCCNSPPLEGDSVFAGMVALGAARGEGQELFRHIAMEMSLRNNSMSRTDTFRITVSSPCPSF